MEALGFIEVYGLVAAIEAADTALKAANVVLVGNKKVTSGIVTVIIKGDVGSVKAAIDSASSAASRVGTVLSSHVIPRMEKEASDILFSEWLDNGDSKKNLPSNVGKGGNKETVRNNESDNVSKKK